MENLHVIKIGGNILEDENVLSSFLNQFSSIDGHKILVHGGGKLATKLSEQLGIKQQFFEGRRITGAETLNIAVMVYAGFINKNIVAKLQAFGCTSVGICGADANLIQAHKRKVSSIDFGFAGDVDSINVLFLRKLLSEGLTIVIAPITHDMKGQLLNTNADTIAQEVAKSLSSFYKVRLIYSFEKSGVLLDVNDENSVIREINPESYKKLKESKSIFEGMLPKLENAFSALEHGVKKVIIGKAEELHELITGRSGTTIVNE